MPTIELICTAGHLATDVPPAALLLDVLEETQAADGAAAAARWVCLECEDLTTTRVSWETLTLLTSVGGHLLEDLDQVDDATPQPTQATQTSQATQPASTPRRTP